MQRLFGAILAALAFFAASEAAGSFAARSLWSGYALAAVDRSYTLPMLIARLGVGALGVAVGGWIAARLAGGRRPAGLRFGIAMLAISLPWHVHIWPHYPVVVSSRVAWLRCALWGGRRYDGEVIA